MNDTKLARLFGTDYKILRFFLGEPQKERNLAEIVRNFKVSKMTLFRSLQRMVEIGVLRSRSDDYRKYYRLVDTPAMRAAKILMNVDSPICNDILKSIGSASCLIMLYGSRASGTDGPRSDWDFLVVSDELDVVAANKIVSNLEKKHDSQINVKLYSTNDYSEMKIGRSPFYQEVMACKYILWGDMGEA